MVAGRLLTYLGWLVMPKLHEVNISFTAASGLRVGNVAARSWLGLIDVRYVADVIALIDVICLMAK